MNRREFMKNAVIVGAGRDLARKCREHEEILELCEQYIRELYLWIRGDWQLVDWSIDSKGLQKLVKYIDSDDSNIIKAYTRWHSAAKDVAASWKSLYEENWGGKLQNNYSSFSKACYSLYEMLGEILYSIKLKSEPPRGW